MKIKQLLIQNYRGFAEAAIIIFPANNTAVFIGVNLDLLAVFLGGFVIQNFRYRPPCLLFNLS